MTRSYVKALSMYYVYNTDEGILKFDDGVVYTLEEALLISRAGAGTRTIRVLHHVKKVFGGEILGVVSTKNVRKKGL